MSCPCSELACSCLALFNGNESLVSAPFSSGPVTAEAAQQVQSWGSEIELVEEFEMGVSFCQTSPANSVALRLDPEARSSFKELDEMGVQAEVSSELPSSHI